MTSRVFILGDSHVHAIKDALEAAAPERQGWSAFRIAKLKNGQPFGELPFAEGIERIRRLDHGVPVVCAIGGNQHQILSLIRHPRPFDFALPGEPFRPAPGSETIPFHAVRDIFEEGLRHGDFERIAAIRQAAHGEVIQLMPPPPKADEAHILRSIETYFAERGLQEHGVTDKAIRLKVWRVQVMVLEALCAKANVRLLPVPPETVTPDGFLAPDFYARDATHANKAYGEQVVRQIAAYLAGSAATGHGA